MEDLKIWIVEDEPPMARFIRSLAEAEGGFCVTGVFESAEEAWRCFEKGEKADVVLSDIRMAEMDGIELLGRLRKQNKELYLVIISGYRMFEYARKAIQLDVEEYITKPIDPKEFSKVLKKIYAEREEQELKQKKAEFEEKLSEADAKELEDLIPVGDFGLFKTLYLKEVLQKEEEGVRKKEKILFEKIVRFTESEMNRYYSLAEISSLFKVSQPYIRKIFKMYAKSTYNEYLLEQKIEFAKMLFQNNPEIRIKDVADAVGIEQFYFSTIFSKNTGMTPTDYKQKLKTS